MGRNVEVAIDSVDSEKKYRSVYKSSWLHFFQKIISAYVHVFACHVRPPMGFELDYVGLQIFVSVIFIADIYEKQCESIVISHMQLLS